MLNNKDKGGLSAWQITMMGLGTVIGGSFFLGSAIAIKAAGPAIIVSYLLGGLLTYLILFSLSEMTVADPAPGSFRTYCEKMYGRFAGFVVGWVYWTGLVLSMSSEAIAVSIFLKNWVPDLSLPLLGSLVIIAITLVNLVGIDRLSKLESGLAAIKVIAIVGFIVLAIFLISGLFPGKSPVGRGEIIGEPLLPGGIGGIAGSMLIVIFTYAGFEIVGLAASEAGNPGVTIPRAIVYTVTGLVGLYIISITLLLPLVPTQTLNQNASPMVMALSRNGLNWAGNIINIVLVSAILSTMLAATFGIGRMIYSLAQEGHAPGWLKDEGEVPYRGIIVSGLAMLAALALGFILPRQVYLFLVSSGGFSFLFIYSVIILTHYKYRKINGCPPDNRCQLPWYPYSSWFAFILLIAIIASMPLIPGQGAGLAAGLIMVFLFSIIYVIKEPHAVSNLTKNFNFVKPQTDLEISEELIEKNDTEENKDD